MAPMARTNRNQTPEADHVNALDSIDLDGDFFANDDDADALFADLDMGLDPLGDITDGSIRTSAADLPKQKLGPPQPRRPPEPNRRKTKRKAKSPVFFDDDDDEYVEGGGTKKKKRKTRSQKAKEKAQQKTKSKNSVSMPPPVSRTGRSRGSSTSPKSKVIPHSVEMLSRIKTPHPDLAQSSFCGLAPSNTLFYPFMPALPAELALKNRKNYPSLDRILTSFMSRMSTPSNNSEAKGFISAKESEPIVHLLQDSFKEEKASSVTAPSANKNDTIGRAVGHARRIIAQMDQPRLTGDLFAACALLKKQYDFLEQNFSNMERWCKDNFSEEDFLSVFTPSHSQRKITMPPTVLASFGSINLKVKIVCPGFKKPKEAPSGPLAAVLPLDYAIPRGLVPVELPPPRKRRPPSNSELKQVTASTATTKKILPYAQMNAKQRCKSVSELVTKTARELESKYYQKLEGRRQTLDRHELELRKLVKEDEALQPIHTTAMWRWLDKSGYCSVLTEEDIYQRLDGLWSPDLPRPTRDFQRGKLRYLGAKSNCIKDGVLFDRLQSLLVEEGTDEEDNEDNDDIYRDLYVNHRDPSMIDLSDFTVDERASLHLAGVGLVDNDFPSSFTSVGNVKDGEPTTQRPTSVVSGHHEEDNHATLAEHAASGHGGDELEDTILSMEASLDQVNRTNNRRVGFLWSRELPHSSSKTKSAEEALIAKCQQLLKKTKEMKVKNGKPKSTKNDDLALPW